MLYGFYKVPNRHRTETETPFHTCHLWLLTFTLFPRTKVRQRLKSCLCLAAKTVSYYLIKEKWIFVRNEGYVHFVVLRNECGPSSSK